MLRLHIGLFTAKAERDMGFVIHSPGSTMQIDPIIQKVRSGRKGQEKSTTLVHIRLRPVGPGQGGGLGLQGAVGKTSGAGPTLT